MILTGYESYSVTRPSAVLVLEDGSVFQGNAYGAIGQTIGEVVFCTAMTGYQEMLTDPSYCGQIVVHTFSHIGNTGWNDEDNENCAGKIWVNGLAMHKPSTMASNWRARCSLEEELIAQNIVSISGIDTRSLVLKLRDKGSLRGGIFSFSDSISIQDKDFFSELFNQIEQSPHMQGSSFSAQVSTFQPYIVPAQADTRGKVVILDLGVKSSTPRLLSQRGLEVHVFPHNSVFADVDTLDINGVLIPNGPGDPAMAHQAVEFVHDVLAADIPLFGICFGNQILARALGRDTYKMRFGHRGINIPVKDIAHDRVYITAQNHGFAIDGDIGEQFDTPYGRAELSHYCLNDNTIEGIRLLSGRAFAVQYHPEAAAGPHDAQFLFDQFTELILETS